MFAHQLINGITIGGIYALIALGYTMVYGILRIVNFAHGDVFMVGSFLGLIIAQKGGLPIYIAYPAAMLATAAVGVLIERICYRPIRTRGADALAILIAALGVSIFLENFAQLVWGTETHSYVQAIKKQSYKIGDISLTNIQIGVIFLCIILMLALYIVVNKAKIGVAMRATSQSIVSAQLMGINTERVIAVTFGVGSALACVAGVLVGTYYDAVYPLVGYSYGLKAFAAAILGGIGSIPGAMLGGFLLGIAETLGAGYISAGYKDAYAFGILILVLIIRPSGLLGRKHVDKV